MINKIKYTLLPARIRRQWSFNEYLRHHMQSLSLKEIEAFLSVDELCELEKQLNSDSHRHIFNDKRNFNKIFSKYLKRDWASLDQMSEADFWQFVNMHEKVVFKPCDMYAGIGIFVIDGKTKASLTSETFAELAKKHYIIEDYVNQYEAYSEFHPFSLNTIRVTTYISEGGTAEILFAVNQFGSNNSIVDNDDSTAIWAGIDLNTGIINAVDIRDSDGFVFDCHPDSGKKFIGFENPFFDKVRKLALEAAYVVPECRLIGWDIAVRDDGEILLIEGNVTPELDLYQIISGKGLKVFERNFNK